MREVVAQAENPVMLYSVGKDSSVMLHLARKAFIPARRRFRLCVLDTRWKFQAMYDFVIHGKRKRHGSVGAYQPRWRCKKHQSL